jgi:hypothetical protein
VTRGESGARSSTTCRDLRGKAAKIKEKRDTPAGR